MVISKGSWAFKLDTSFIIDTSTQYTSIQYTSTPYTSIKYTSTQYISTQYTSTQYTSIQYTSIQYRLSVHEDIYLNLVAQGICKMSKHVYDIIIYHE